MKTPGLRILLFAFVTVTVSVPAQTVLLTLTDPEPGADNFGGYHAATGAGDVNGDGIPDVVIGAPQPAKDSRGFAEVRSGADGSILHRFIGLNPGDQFGFSVDAAGDVNADGFADVIVGAVRSSITAFSAGGASVFSGKDGSRLRHFDGVYLGDNYGYSVAGVGDANGDGYDDVAMAAHQADPQGGASGEVRVFSGVDGVLLHVFAGDGGGHQLGWSLAGAGDVNGDGHGDLIAGAIGSIPEQTSGHIAGYARVYSGADGSILHTFHGDTIFDLFGYSVDAAGDVNGDGYDDLIVGAPQDSGSVVNGSGYAKVLSGRDGSVLLVFAGENPKDSFGAVVAGPGDVNGDGTPDLAVGASNFSIASGRVGKVYVYSGVDGSLIGDWVGTGSRVTAISLGYVGDINGGRANELVVGHRTLDEVVVLTFRINRDPICDAGADQVVESQGVLSAVSLDGGASVDPDGDPVSFEWSVPSGSGASLDDPTSPSPFGLFPLGVTLVSLTASDDRGGVSVCSVAITVQDTLRPVVACTTEPIVLWPPNRAMIPVQLRLEVSDSSSPADLEVDCRIRSSEPDDAQGDVSFIGDVDGSDGFAAPVPVALLFDVQENAFLGAAGLRAERNGAGASRVYSLICIVTDSSGNETTASSVVVVPHDRRR